MLLSRICKAEVLHCFELDLSHQLSYGCAPLKNCAAMNL